MPLILPNDLPAAKILQDENIFVMQHQRAVTQDIRPLEIIIINLMPDKIVTETQLARVLANSPLQVRLTLLRPGSHESTHTPKKHIGAFYQTLEEVKQHRYDGMIITGAPIEHLPFEQVTYWDEFREIIEFSKKSVYSTIYLCWAALAGLYYHHGIDKVALPQKLHGVYPHTLERVNNPLVRGYDEEFWAPHSRNAGVNRADIDNAPKLRVLAESEEAGVHLLSTENGREIYVMGHPEYDKETLQNEYLRDKAAGLNPPVPRNYYRDNNPDKGILFRWRSHAHLLYTNWLNYYVYQETPFDLSSLQP